MCANYRPSARDELQQRFQVAPPDSEYKNEAFPGYMAPFIRLPRADAMAGDRACALGMFGIVPFWADIKFARNTYNAKTETLSEKKSYRTPYKRGQFCVIPAHSFFEPKYDENGENPVRWEIASSDGGPLGIAGIWEQKQDGPNGLPLLSFSMLTINADGHSLMQQFHEPNKEKRMVVLLHPDQYDDWLTCPVEEAPDFFNRYPAEQLVAHAAPLQRKKKAAQQTLLDD